MTDPLSLDDPHVAAVLDGRARYDDLDRDRQAVVRAEWDARAEERLRGLSFADEYLETGELVPEADEKGALVWSDPRTGDRLESTSQDLSPAYLPRFVVDLTIFGDSRSFQAPVPRANLGRLRVGDHVVVPGDSSPDRMFLVVALDEDGHQARLSEV